MSSFNAQSELCRVLANKDKFMRLAVLPEFIGRGAMKYGENMHMLATGTNAVPWIELKG